MKWGSTDRSGTLGNAETGPRLARNWRALGDLTVSRVGLLHPVVVTSDGRLVAGERRLVACRSLGWTDVPVTVADSLADARAERGSCIEASLGTLVCSCQ